MKAKVIPVRTCVACRMERPKSDLVRIVRTPQGDVILDTRGKISGRGAYLCPSLECLTIAVKKKALERALGVSFGEETLSTLREVLKERVGSAPR